MVTALTSAAASGLGLGAVTPSSSSPLTVTPGGSAVATFTCRATGAGTANFGFRTTGTDATLGGAIWFDSTVAVAAAGIVAPPVRTEPAVGKALASPNVLDRSDPATPVRVAFRGDAGGTAHVTLYDERGAILRAWDVALDGTGRGALAFDGLDDAGHRLGSGLFWLRATGGGVNDRIRVGVTAKRH